MVVRTYQEELSYLEKIATSTWRIKKGFVPNMKVWYICSKISNTFLFLFSNKLLIFMAGIHKMDVRIASSEDLDQTTSSEKICYMYIEDIQMFLLNMSFISRVKLTIFIFHEWRSHE